MPRPIDPRVRPPLSVALRERFYMLRQGRRMRRIARYRHADVDARAVVEAVRRKQLVVTITAGRSGTTYLASVLGILPGVSSPHEAPPHYVYAMRHAQHDRDAARRFLLEYKLPTIAAAPAPRYADVNHLLCKGFLEPLLDLGIIPGAILLRRAPRAVATSWLTRGQIPGRNRGGLRMHLHPGDPGVLPLPQWGTATDYQLCFWYALEIERRQRAYGAHLEQLGAAVVDVTADELHDPQCFLEVASRLSLLDPAADREALLAAHRAVSVVVHKPNLGPPRAARPEEEESVWAAIAPTAPDLRAALAARYASAPAPR